MRKLAPFTLIALLTLILCSCGSGSSSISSAGASNPGYGPFDRHGNYVEEWADKPAKKHRWARKPEPAPVKEEPKLASNTRSQEQARTRPSSSSRSRETEVASLARSSTPPRTYTPPAQPKPAIASTPPAPKPTPKPKPTPVKPKAPPPVRHTVVKGDTLYNLSRRYGTSISAIQRANGIKGTTIRLGQTLLIPR